MAKSAGWRAGAGIGGAALLLSIGCDDVRTVDAVQSPRDVGAAVDLGPIDDAGSAGQDAAGADASPGADAGPGPDAARCDPPCPPSPRTAVRDVSRPLDARWDGSLCRRAL
jgi:hypothetical protein